MTRDEAKMVLELIRDRYSSVDVDRLSLTDAETDAINMAIEALEQKYAEWIIEEEGLYLNSTATAYCSNCRHYINWFEDNYGSSTIRYLPNYCSNCGSYMRKILPKL